MKVQIEVPEYSVNGSLRMTWEANSRIDAQIKNGTILLRGNKPGLLSLARLFLTLVDDQVPPGNHWHLDPSNALEDDSNELIVEVIA